MKAHTSQDAQQPFKCIPNFIQHNTDFFQVRVNGYVSLYPTSLIAEELSILLGKEWAKQGLGWTK